VRRGKRVERRRADIWGRYSTCNDIVLNELTKIGILNSNHRTMRGLAVAIREAMIHRMIRHTNLLTIVRLGGLDPIPQKDTKLKIASSHGWRFGFPEWVMDSLHRPVRDQMQVTLLVQAPVQVLQVPVQDPKEVEYCEA